MSKLIIMFGPSGSGKSRWLETHYPSIKVFSADHWFSRSGTYRWDRNELDAAHSWCLRNLILHTADVHGTDAKQDIAVDNAFTTAVSAQPVMMIGRAMGYEVIPVCMVPEGGWTEELAARVSARNQHGVPTETVSKSGINLNYLLQKWPYFWPSPVRVAPILTEVLP